MAINTVFMNRVLELTNQFRAKNGLAPLMLNPELITAAQNHSQDMALRDYFAHTSPINGSTFDSRARSLGYVGSYMGENIAVGYSTPEQVVQTWINSSGHRANLLNPNYKELGIGYYYLGNDTGKVNYNYYWTQVFGSGDTNPATKLPQPRLDLGNLPSNPTLLSSNLATNNSSDLYKFILSATNNLNLSLHAISSGDNADLYLYRDNGNGVFDTSDTLIQRPYKAGNSDEAINVRAAAGTYFARVNLYSGGSDSRLHYDLDLSATPINPYPADSPTQAPNLLPKEIVLGNLSLGTTLSSDPTRVKTITRSGSVGNSNTADTYNFKASSKGNGVRINASLTGLVSGSNADIRLIRDSDRDGVVDAGEVIAKSNLGSNSNESFSYFLGNSYSTYDHFIQVYQYSGNTNYNLNMTFTSTLS